MVVTEMIPARVVITVVETATKNIRKAYTKQRKTHHLNQLVANVVVEKTDLLFLTTSLTHL